MDVVELTERGEFDYGLHVAFKQRRQNNDADGRVAAQAGVDFYIVAGDIADQDALFFAGALADQAFSDPELHRDVAFIRWHSRRGV